MATKGGPPRKTKRRAKSRAKFRRESLAGTCLALGKNCGNQGGSAAGRAVAHRLRAAALLVRRCVVIRVGPAPAAWRFLRVWIGEEADDLAVLAIDEARLDDEARRRCENPDSASRVLAHTFALPAMLLKYRIGNGNIALAACRARC